MHSLHHKYFFLVSTVKKILDAEKAEDFNVDEEISILFDGNAGAEEAGLAAGRDSLGSSTTFSVGQAQVLEKIHTANTEVNETIQLLKAFLFDVLKNHHDSDPQALQVLQETLDQVFGSYFRHVRDKRLMSEEAAVDPSNRSDLLKAMNGLIAMIHATRTSIESCRKVLLLEGSKVAQANEQQIATAADGSQPNSEDEDDFCDLLEKFLAKSSTTASSSVTWGNGRGWELLGRLVESESKCATQNALLCQHTCSISHVNYFIFF